MYKIRKFASIQEIRDAIGEQLGPTELMPITEFRIKAFAESTNDYQAIHLDEQIAKDAGFENVLAHGYLLLSLMSKFSYELYELVDMGPIINYGTDKVRFIRPVIANDEVSASATIIGVEQKGEMELIKVDYKLTNQRSELVMVASTIIAIQGVAND